MIQRFIESLGLDPKVFDARSEIEAGNASDAEGSSRKSAEGGNSTSVADSHKHGEKRAPSLKDFDRIMAGQ